MDIGLENTDKNCIQIANLYVKIWKMKLAFELDRTFLF